MDLNIIVKDKNNTNIKINIKTDLLNYKIIISGKYKILNVYQDIVISEIPLNSNENQILNECRNVVNKSYSILDDYYNLKNILNNINKIELV